MLESVTSLLEKDFVALVGKGLGMAVIVALIAWFAVESVWGRVKGYRVFRDFGTDLKPGINVLIGTNGSGKSTLVELLRIIQSCCLGPVPPGIERRPGAGTVFHPDAGDTMGW